jgi:hypothetical protein
MNIVRGVADLLRKAPPPAAPGGDVASASKPAAGLDDVPTPRIVFRYACPTLFTRVRHSQMTE